MELMYTGQHKPPEPPEEPKCGLDEVGEIGKCTFRFYNKSGTESALACLDHCILDRRPDLRLFFMKGG